jgi:hypothetical protein
MTLREERRLRVLRRVFVSKRDEVTGEWELHDLYSSPTVAREIKSSRMRWSGHVARMGRERGVYRILVGKPEGKRPLGRLRRRWEDNIKIGLEEVECVASKLQLLKKDSAAWSK